MTKREVTVPREDLPESKRTKPRPPTPYDNLPDESFDRVARLVASSLHAPISIVSLLDADRHVVKSSIGLTGRSRVWRKVPLALAFSRQAARFFTLLRFRADQKKGGIAVAS